MKTRVDRTTLGFSIGLSLFAAVAVLGVWTTGEVVDTVHWVDHTHRVIETLDELGGTLSELESTKRGHVLTGSDDERRRFTELAPRLDQLEQALRALSADNPAQQRRLDRLAPVLAERRNQLRAGLGARWVSASDAERERGIARVGSAASRRIHDVIGEMTAIEQALLAEREERTQRFLATERLVHGAGAVTGLFVLALGFKRMRREMRLRRASEAALRESEESISTTLHSIGDGVIATDAEGRVTRLNPVAEELTGWSAAEAVGQPFEVVFRIVNEQTRDAAPDPITRVLRDGVVVALANHTSLIGANGRETQIADSAAPIRALDGSLTGAVLVFRDATEERTWAAKIREANAFLDSIVENTPDMVFVKDAANLRFVRFNQAAETILGVSRDAMIGKSDHDLFPKQLADGFRAADRHVLEQKRRVEIAEEAIDTPTGKRWLQTTKIPILDETGAPAYLLGVSQDITERKMMSDTLRSLNDGLERRIEERTSDLIRANEELEREVGERRKTAAALQRSEQQLHQAQKMEAVGRLAGGIAHDFNNLLSVILSYSAMLLTELEQDSPVRADVEEMQKAGMRAADLTRQLLAFSRQQVLAPRVVHLGSVVAGMEKLLRRVIGEDIELVAVSAARGGNARVDPGQIEQVIMNLVVNARDAMPRGGRITIETATVELDSTHASAQIGLKPGPYCLLAVTDTGEGMDRQTQERIFEPFFTTKEQGKGTGLGLSTVFGIVRQSGGNVLVYSEVGSGTVFKIYFPEVLAAAVELEPAVRSRPAGGSETVLLVEDEQQVRTLTRSILTKFGYQVLDASDGEEGLLLCARFSGRIDLVVTDVVMPKMSGRELVERVSTLRPETKVLFMSGYTDDTVVRHGVLAQGVAFLQKPITPDSLTRKVREVLDAR